MGGYRNPELSLNCKLVSSNGKNKTLRVFRHYQGECLDITFKRTIRVPDNKDSSYLPPDLGTFGLHAVSVYKDTLPPDMAAKGGVFFSIYRKQHAYRGFQS